LIKIDLREIGWEVMEWIQLAQYGDWWWALVNTVMNLRVLASRSYLLLMLNQVVRIVSILLLRVNMIHGLLDYGGGCEVHGSRMRWSISDCSWSFISPWFVSRIFIHMQGRGGEVLSGAKRCLTFYCPQRNDRWCQARRGIMHSLVRKTKWSVWQRKQTTDGRYFGGRTQGTNRNTSLARFWNNRKKHD
jgi:hypothetical protein